MPRQFYTIFEHKRSILRPLLSITFPQRFRISKIFGHCTLRSGGKKTFKRSEQMKKIPKKLFLPRRFYTIFQQKSSNLRPLLSITFPQGFRISKKFGHWTSGCGSKKTVKHSEQSVTDRQTHKRKTNRKWQNPSSKKSKSALLTNSKAYPSWQKLRDDNNFFLSARISFWIFKKSTFWFFWRSLFFLTAPPSLSKTPTDMV